MTKEVKDDGTLLISLEKEQQKVSKSKRLHKLLRSHELGETWTSQRC